MDVLQDDFELVQIISHPNWPLLCSPASNVFELVHLVKDNLTQQTEDEECGGGPVIVVDRWVRYCLSL